MNKLLLVLTSASALTLGSCTGLEYPDLYSSIGSSFTEDLSSNQNTEESSYSSEIIIDSTTSSESIDQEQPDLPYLIYLAALENGFIGSYESWLSSVRGEDGQSIQLRVFAEMIQWKYVNDIFWNDLMTLSEIQGASGLQGNNGIDGLVPEVGENGNWWIGQIDTKIPAGQHGVNGVNGQIPFVGDNGNWWIGQIDTGILARGSQGMSAYELYLIANPDYMGSERDWINELISGSLFKIYHEVVFNTLGNGFIPIQFVEDGKKIVKPIDPESDWLIFQGWFVENERWIFMGFAVTESIELTARWSPKTFNITYELNGGENHPNNPTSFSSDQIIELFDPTKTGHEFLGWYIDETMIEIFDGTIMASHLILFAKWKPNTYTINYVLNGGVNHQDNPNQYTYGTSIVFLTPFRENYNFLGWYLNSNFVTGIQSVTPLTIGTLTLHAKWESNLEVEVTSVNLSSNKIGMVIGNYHQLSATVFPSNATNKNLLWNSSNNTIATVSSTGNIYARAHGSVTITATSTNGTSASALIRVRYDIGDSLLVESEPNGTKSSADQFSANGTTISGQNSSKSDLDYYSVYLPSNSVLTVIFAAQYSIDNQYFLIGIENSTIAVAAIYGSTGVMQYTIPSSGTYYIGVLYSSSSPYTRGDGYAIYVYWI